MELFGSLEGHNAAAVLRDAGRVAAVVTLFRDDISLAVEAAMEGNAGDDAILEAHSWRLLNEQVTQGIVGVPARRGRTQSLLLLLIRPASRRLIDSEFHHGGSLAGKDSAIA